MENKYYTKIKEELEQQINESYEYAEKFHLMPVPQNEVERDFLLSKIAQLQQEICNLKTKEIKFK